MTVAEIQDPNTDWDDQLLVDDIDDFKEVSTQALELFLKVRYAFSIYITFSIVHSFQV